MVTDLIWRIPAGEVKVFFSANVAETLQSFEIANTTITNPAKVVVQTWATLPAQEQLITEVLHHLADIVLATWPFWYGQNMPITSAALSAMPFEVTHPLPKQEQLRQPIAPLWLKQAIGACAAGQRPLFHDFTRGQQLSQLALTIEPSNLLLILALDDAQPLPYRLFGLARTAVWLATTTAARVALLAPVTLTAHSELESILYGAIVDTIVDSAPVAPPATVDENAKGTLWPIQGRPHPFSPGEQLLAKALAQDAALAPLFGFNQKVTTVCNSSYWVDLLWPAGRVIVEVDGYKIHSKRAIFTSDRRRDYELLLSGYTVLRLPHDEVMADVTAALEKIRRVTAYVGNSHCSLSTDVQRRSP